MFANDKSSLFFTFILCVYYMGLAHAVALVWGWRTACGMSLGLGCRPLPAEPSCQHHNLLWNLVILQVFIFHMGLTNYSFFFFYNLFLLFYCMSVLSMCTYIFASWGGGKPLCGCWEWNLGLFQQQQMPLTTEPTLQAQKWFLKKGTSFKYTAVVLSS